MSPSVRAGLSSASSVASLPTLPAPAACECKSKAVFPDVSVAFVNLRISRTVPLDSGYTVCEVFRHLRTGDCRSQSTLPCRL